jgi:hypothetical protein
MFGFYQVIHVTIITVGVEYEAYIFRYKFA